MVSYTTGKLHTLLVDMQLLLEVFVFVILMVLIATNKGRLAALMARSYEDWILDIVNLFFQVVLIPVFKTAVLYQLYHYFLPSHRQSWDVPPVAAFCLSFVFVDYLFYWNHRLLHTRWFWRVHQVHHTITEMDVIATSRETLWSTFLTVYPWVHALFIYLLRDPIWYVAGVSLSSTMSLWRHSAFSPTPSSWLYRWLSVFLILPKDHAWHHASRYNRRNYGANLKLWDMLHGTYYKCDRLPDSLGVKTNLTLTQKLFWPFSQPKTKYRYTDTCSLKDWNVRRQRR